MKLLKLHLTLFSVFVTLIALSQQNTNGIIHYESTINGKKMSSYINKKRKKIKNKRLVKTLDKVFLYTKPIKSTLMFSKGKGLFKVEDKLSTDIHNLGQRINKTSAGGSKEYFYNDRTKEYLTKDCEAIGECFIFTNNFLEWQLTQETKMINSFMCYKATRSNGKVVAWYTPSIPISFGPKGEYGLPGLILKLEIGKIIFKATKIILNPKKIPKIKRPKKGKRLTYEEYEKELKKAKKSVFGKTK